MNDCGIRAMLRKIGFLRSAVLFFRTLSVISRRNPFILFVRGRWNHRVCIIAEILLFPVSLILFFYRSAVYAGCGQRAFRYGISVVAIIKNEAPYLAEWIRYHQLAGISHFYLFDNESEDDTRAVPKPFIEKGIVSCHLIPGRMRQYDAYNMALNRYASETKYLAVMDADEFLYADVATGCVCDVIERILTESGAPGVGINWCMYGSACLEHRPQGLVIQNYLYHARKDFISNHYIKTVCNPRKVIGFRDAHCPVYYRGEVPVNVRKGPVCGPVTEQVLHEPVRINHYFTKSREEFLKKCARGMADKPGRRNLDNFEAFDKNDIYDDCMVKFVEQCTGKDVLMYDMAHYK